MNKGRLYLINKEGYYRLMFNGSEVGRFRAKKNSDGLVVRDNALKLHGTNIAGSTMENPNLVVNTDTAFFGETSLIRESGKCINITASDYTNLIEGNAVPGYLIYSHNDIYNIVDDIDEAEEITYTNTNGTLIFNTGLTAHEQLDLLYGNIEGALPHNTEDPVNTVSMLDAPFVSVKYFDQVIEAGSSIELTYNVDTEDMAKTNYDNVERTFTVEVETQSGLITKRTTYGGVFKITTPEFNTPGETWFSIRCIDNRGVSSPTLFFDILVKDQIVYNVYTMKSSDFNKYEIVPNDNTVQYPTAQNNYTLAAPYNNKAALSEFFADIKSKGYNKVIMYNNSDDNDGEGTIYWIDLHSAEGFGTKEFYRCGWKAHKITSVTSNIPLSEIISNYEYLHKWKSGPTTKRTEPPYVGMSFGNALDFYLRCNGKYYCIEVRADIVITQESTTQNRIPWYADWIDVDSVPNVGDAWDVPEENRYMVINTSRSGDDDNDHLVFPDEFTVDLNGSTLAAAYCDDIKDGALIYLEGNYDLHIVNGKIKGNYDTFDFQKACINLGTWIPCEQMHLIYAKGTKFCSFENLDESNSVGYDWFFVNNDYKTNMPIDDGPLDIWVGGIDYATGQDTSASDMVVTKLMDITPYYKDRGEVGVVRLGTRGYWADTTDEFGNTVSRRNYFISFYDDRGEDGGFIKTIKSKLYYGVKIPQGATKCRVCGYGTLSQWNYIEGGGPYVLLKERCIGTKISNCYIHDSRTSVIGGGEISGKSYENCTFENVAKESGIHAVTAILGDMEDSWQETFFYQIKDCNVISGKRSISVNYCQHLTFENNNGIAIASLGGYEDGFVFNNDIPKLSLVRNWRCPNPHVLYKGNTILAFAIKKDKDGIALDFINQPLTMEDTTIVTKSHYEKLKLKNSVNGNDIYD